MRVVPSNGLVIAPRNDENIGSVLDMGAWTPIEYFGVKSENAWSYQLVNEDGSAFEVFFDGRKLGTVTWPLMGLHNVTNAIAAIAAARHAGVPPAQSIESFSDFVNVKRRMELRGSIDNINVYDDFAHHPTAVATTIQGLRNRVGTQRIIAILEPRSNTMRMGIHQDSLASAFESADAVILFHPKGLEWSFDQLRGKLGAKVKVFDSVEDIIQDVAENATAGDQVLIMSNGGFENIHVRLLNALEEKHG
jgi:UDP-N-acetylmuramate: L-alanyl-gamma-D-glutamyl-meso-diaminopimelate ligase